MVKEDEEGEEEGAEGAEGEEGVEKLASDWAIEAWTCCVRGRCGS